MALIKCKECGSQVSNKANACPACGHPVKKKASISSGCGCALVLLAILFIAVQFQSATRNSGGAGRSLSKPQATPKETTRRIPPSSASEKTIAKERNTSGVAFRAKAEKENKVPAAQEVTNSLGMKLRLIPAGKFLMGSPSHEAGRLKGRFEVGHETQHEVILTQSFYMGETEATQAQYQAVMGVNPSSFRGSGDLPVEKVSWDDAVEFCQKISDRETSAGLKYRLPTEAEWEYACRAGSTTRFCFGDSDSGLAEYGWYYDNAGEKTHPVGQKKPNAWGLFDMHGNVSEWCSDWYASYPASSVTDPTGPASGSSRVYRGFCWMIDARFCRSASRSIGLQDNSGSDNLGFRVVAVRESR